MVKRNFITVEVRGSAFNNIKKNYVTTQLSKDAGYNYQFKKSVILKNTLPKPGNI